MDSITIDTGEKRIAINNDPERVIVFNPSDVIFAEKFYALTGEFQKKLTEYEVRSKAVEANSAVDENGILINFADRMALLHEVCDFIRERIDHLFGIGTSQKAFGDALTLTMFEQFFNGITPFVQGKRAEKIAQYTTPASAKRNKRKV